MQRIGLKPHICGKDRGEKLRESVLQLDRRQIRICSPWISNASNVDTSFNDASGRNDTTKTARVWQRFISFSCNVLVAAVLVGCKKAFSQILCLNHESWACCLACQLLAWAPQFEARLMN